MKRFVLAIAAVLTIVGTNSAQAISCTNSFSLGDMSPPAVRIFGNTFGSVQHFDDCFAFTLNNPGSALGLSFALDLSWMRDISLTSASLSGGLLPSAITDTSPGSFSFDNLSSGVYQLTISGNVTGSNGGIFGGGAVGYSGLFTTVRTDLAEQAAPVPAPMAGAGIPGLVMAFGGLIAWRRRRNQAAVA